MNGDHPGFSRNHAKGVCLLGAFESNGNAARLSTAPRVRARPHAGDRPFRVGRREAYVADGPAAVRSMALCFPPDGEEWRTGMNDIPVFPVSTPAGLLRSAGRHGARSGDRQTRSSEDEGFY